MPERCVFWRRRNTLLLADLHLGKCETFHAFGASLPAAVNTEMLHRLSSAVEQTGATNILILGDLLHAPAGLTPQLVNEVGLWRSTVSASIWVVPGNHDRRLADVIKPWQMEITPPGTTDGPFAFHHFPVEHDGLFTWCGHEHPARTLRSAGDMVKVSGFVIGPRLGILPAFTRFAAGGGKCDQGSFFPIVEGEVLEPLLPPRGNRIVPVSSGCSADDRSQKQSI